MFGDTTSAKNAFKAVYKDRLRNEQPSGGRRLFFKCSARVAGEAQDVMRRSASLRKAWIVKKAFLAHWRKPRSNELDTYIRLCGSSSAPHATTEPLPSSAPRTFIAIVHSFIEENRSASTIKFTRNHISAMVMTFVAFANGIAVVP